MRFTQLIHPKSELDFEIIVKNYLEFFLGFRNMETTPLKGDYGADLLGEKDDQTYVVQIKYYTGSVGLKAIQEAHTAMGYYAKDRCMVVTNSTYTKPAIKLANSIKCILIDGNDLDKMYSEKFESFDEQIEYLKHSKLRSFKITNEQLRNNYFELKAKLGRQPRINDINSKGDYSASIYKKRWGRWNLFLKDIKEDVLVNRDITKNELIENFHNVKDRIDRIPTIKDMKMYGSVSISTYGSYFGGWNKFLVTQGLISIKRYRISKEDFISEFKRIKSKLKKVPTKLEFDNHANISSNSYRRIWGSWNAFLKDQGESPNHREYITDEELIQEYYKLKVYLGKNYLRQIDMKAGRFSSSTYERRFGSWKKFLNYIKGSLNSHS